ncbi:protein translocase subunit yajC [Verrucomicrobium sp. GAS474]|uniref:preprotein translocase subunit YajC n=1 Tax=Verrucomicrobium sp. GAS474 TaxID=1882831 RepID=UPI00087C0817|nr:preprotein translocase subunit YajC [Verrucomicrobium sp. GAS474]SDT86631.1 protein translocase subunit yajC [Verrucomicrobium sp. GAS474]
MTTYASILAMAPAAVDPATGAPSQPAWVGMMFPLLIIVLFYFLLIRPQQKARKEQQKLIDNIKNGDEVTLTSGILGTVTNVKETTVVVRVDEGVKLEVLKAAIATVGQAGPKTI